MTGYQEIFTDPSYHGQLMVTTNSHIGNYGILNKEAQSKKVNISGLICKNFSYEFSRPGASSLYEYLKVNQIITVSDVDTRAVVSYIREHGAMNAVISTEADKIEDLKKQLAECPQMEGLELASKVSTKEPYFYGNENATYKIAALDIGIKLTFLEILQNEMRILKFFRITLNSDEMSSWNPDGYFYQMVLEIQNH